jgi:hypothetical protein
MKTSPVSCRGVYFDILLLGVFPFHPEVITIKSRESNACAFTPLKNNAFSLSGFPEAP